MVLHRALAIPISFLVMAIFGLSVVVPPASASPYPTATKDDSLGEQIYSPYAGRSYPDQVLFGDAHFHTNLSFDAGLIGTRLDMDAEHREKFNHRLCKLPYYKNSLHPVRLGL